MFRDRVARDLGSARSLSLLLDYDGTLVPFATAPERAVPDAALLSLLGRLAARPHTHVAIVSGRDPDSLDRFLGDLPIRLVAEHGLLRRDAHSRTWSSNVSIAEDARRSALASLGELARSFGGFIEEKRGGGAWHYRGLAIAEGDVSKMERSLTACVSPLGYEVLRGSCVVEIRRSGVNKGLAVASARAETPTALVAAIGDDETDEDMFASLPEGGVSARVGERPTIARYRLADHEAVRHVLAHLADS